MELDRLGEGTVENLDTVVNDRDMRRDIHLFIDYIRSRDVKRTHRTNEFYKADLKRLAKLLGDPETVEDVRSEGRSRWIEFIDQFSRFLGFVRYDTKGVYIGYTSTTLSYPDNYIDFEKENYERFLSKSLGEQEQYLLDTFVELRGECKNEFFMQFGPLAILDRFNRYGCATAVAPLIDFTTVRRFLLEELRQCESAVWYSTASFVQYLKREHPYFMIPKDPKLKPWEKEKGRYQNFREARSRSRGTPISEDAPDGFERVEGRYIERFLEGLPLTMQYLEVAYDPTPLTDDRIRPSRGRLVAFRITERFKRVMRGALGPPEVTVQPNFEIHIASDLYPVNIMKRLAPITSPVKSDVAIIVKLEKGRVAEALVEDDTLDVIELLTTLSGKPLPRNVVTELKEWTAHTDRFVLYPDYALLECEPEIVLPEKMTVEEITAALRIIRTPKKVFDHLEQAAAFPLFIAHTKAHLKKVPNGVDSLIAPSKKKKKKKEPQKSTQTPKANGTTRGAEANAQRSRKPTARIGRRRRIVLELSSEELLKTLSKALLEEKCQFSIERSQRTITYPASQESRVDEILASIAKEYTIEIEDID